MLKYILFFSCIIPFLACSQIDTLYIKFDTQNINEQGYFKNHILYHNHKFKKAVYEIQYKCNFNKIRVDSAKTVEEEAFNIGAYIGRTRFYFSNLVHLNKELNKRLFLKFLISLNDKKEWAEGFDLYKIIAKDTLSKLSIDELYKKTKPIVDSLHERNGQGYYGSRIYNSTFFKRRYNKDFKLLKQTIIDKKKLNENNFIDLAKKVNATPEFTKLFNKIRKAKVIFLTTTYTIDSELVLFNEVFFNEHIIKIR